MPRRSVIASPAILEPAHHFFFDVSPAALGDVDEAAGLAALKMSPTLGVARGASKSAKGFQRSETCRLVFVTKGSWTDVKEEMIRRLYAAGDAITLHRGIKDIASCPSMMLPDSVVDGIDTLIYGRQHEDAVTASYR
jgi:hypothetical protein